MKQIIITLLFGFALSVQADECTFDTHVLKADYTFSLHKIKENTVLNNTITVWRNGPSVIAQTNHAHDVTDMWFQAKKGVLQLVRYFDHDQRAIEYQPNEIRAADDHWQVFSELVTEADRNKMQRVKQEGTGCDVVEFYEFESHGNKVELQWMPNKRLVKEYKTRTHDHEETWHLESVINDAEIIKAAFDKRDSFYATDYADVGDNESDPFLLKMINLGHIAHGGSGFYDADGHDIGEHHH